MPVIGVFIYKEMVKRKRAVNSLPLTSSYKSYKLTVAKMESHFAWILNALPDLQVIVISLQLILILHQAE